MSAEIPFLSLIHVGSKRFPRFLVAKADELRNPIYWTGQDWAKDDAKAMVFADVNQALWTYHDLLVEAVADRPSFVYLVPLQIEVFGEKPKLADLKEWLEKAVRIVVDTPKQGYGPGDTVGLITVDFNKTRIV
jgi:hypothetical protein